MTFDSEIVGALIGGIVAIVLYHLGNLFYKKLTKDEKEQETFERFIRMETKINDILALQDRVSKLESNCIVNHKSYDDKLNKLKNTDDMAAKDLERLFKEIESVNYSVNQLKDSNKELVEQLKSLIKIDEQRNLEQDKKIDDLYNKFNGLK